MLTVDGAPDEVVPLGAVTGARQWARNLTGFRVVFGSYPTGVLLDDGSLVAADRAGVYRMGADGAEQWRNTYSGGDVLSDDLLITPGGLVIAATLLCGGDIGSAEADMAGADADAGAEAAPQQQRRRRRQQQKRRQQLLQPRSAAAAANARLRAPAVSYPYFALDVATGAFAWGVSLPGATINFCSTAVLGPVTATDPNAALADGALWVTTATLTGEDNLLYGIAFNPTHAWVAATGAFPGTGMTTSRTS